MKRDDVINEYFNWLYEIVCEGRFPATVSYRKLLMYLHSTEFTYSILKDKNRAADGVDLRYRFELACDRIHASRYLKGPCSVLEMMVALAIRCEETIMDDPQFGNRTSQWFWSMIVSLGLGNMIDSRFDKNKFDEVIDRFLKREYDADGSGGLFTVKNSFQDLRDVEIWTQMCLYLDNLI